ALAKTMAQQGATVMFQCERGTSSACPCPYLESLPLMLNGYTPVVDGPNFPLRPNNQHQTTGVEFEESFVCKCRKRRLRYTGKRSHWHCMQQRVPTGEDEEEAPQPQPSPAAAAGAASVADFLRGLVQPVDDDRVRFDEDEEEEEEEDWMPVYNPPPNIKPEEALRRRRRERRLQRDPTNAPHRSDICPKREM
ncbi:hypothetical protein HDU76_012321, partial [Blyttiomyces sp. JEL0837]